MLKVLTDVCQLRVLWIFANIVSGYEFQAALKRQHWICFSPKLKLLKSSNLPKPALDIPSIPKGMNGIEELQLASMFVIGCDSSLELVNFFPGWTPPPNAGKNNLHSHSENKHKIQAKKNSKSYQIIL